MLKKKYDDSDMKKNMQAQYGKEEGKKVYFATIRKQAMKKEEVENKEDPSIKAKLERQAMIKKQVLMKKLQAVRAGAGADITSSYKPDGEILQERQKTNQGHRQSEEQHRSNYGKASIRNVRATGKGGNAADPAERLVAMDSRHKAHKEKRGVKTKGMKEEVGISSAVRMKKARDEAMLRLKEKQAVARKMKKEEVEVVNEVSKKTLGTYIKKASTDLATRSIKHGMSGGTETGGDPDSPKNVEKINKRHSGIMKAADKLQKEGAYMGPNKEDKKLIKKMDNPSYAKKLADYEKIMDPKKRQELKNKATKGMKFTHEAIKYDKSGSSMDYFLGADPKKTKEYKALKKKKTQKEGTSYGLYKGSGKASGAMKDYLDKKAKMLTKKRNKQSDAAKNNPHFDSTQPSPSGRNKYEEVQRDGYGDPIGGPKISKKQKAKNLASNTPDEQHTTTTSEAVTFQHFMEKCWKGYEKKGMKTMFGKRYPNCVKKEEVELTDEGYGSDRVGPALTIARVIDRVNPKPKMGSKRSAISNMLKMASIKKDEKIRKEKENPYSAKKKLKMIVKSIAQKEDYIPEEGYDIARDMGKVRPSKDKKDGTTMPPSAEMKKTQKVNKGPSAFERVKKKYGKAVMVIGKK
jgi:hypothetical protein